jgi:hypothetical protein
MKKCYLIQHYILVIVMMASVPSFAQFSLSGQLRTRTEFRDGQGTLTPKGADPAFFTSQRTRLIAGYLGDRLRLQTTIQDVRVWGQDVSTINRTTTASNNGTMVHEAWAEIMLVDTTSAIDNLSVKIGRQELLYDDSRLLGNLDWLQQARRHDAAVIKVLEKNWQADAGFAFNQNAELTSGSIYHGQPVGGYSAGTNGIGVMYKAMQFFYLKRKLSHGYGSFLFLKDDFNKYHMDTTARISDKGVWSRLTTGVNYSDSWSKKLSVFISFFVQKGRNKDGSNLSAWFFSLNGSYELTKKVNVSVGTDWLSGNDGTKTNSTDHRFDPLYGTPHKFWGYMDYFYVASPTGSQGLKDYFVKFRFKPSGKLTINLDAHEFYSANKITNETGGKRDNRLGTEFDLITTYTLTKDIAIEAGYCTMFATSTLSSPQMKNVANADKSAHWVYLMLNIKPDFLKHSK